LKTLVRNGGRFFYEKILLMKSIILLTLISLSYFAKSQELNNLVYSSKITTLAYFKKNDFKKYNVLQTTTQKKDSEDQTINKMEYNISIRVIDSTENSYKLELMYSDYVLPPTTRDFEKELVTCFKDVKIIYSTNENGEFEKIENIAEIKTATLKLLDLIKKKFTAKLKTDLEKEAFNTVFLGYDALMNQDENIENMFLEDILFLHGIYGIELKLNEEEDFEIEFPVIGDVSVKGISTVTLKDINKETKVSKISINEQANPQELEKYLQNIMQSLFGHLSENLDAKKFKVESKTNQIYFMFLDSGWMKKITSTNIQNLEYEEHKMKKTISKDYTLSN
jgi:hypothetical protein